MNQFHIAVHDNFCERQANDLPESDPNVTYWWPKPNGSVMFLILIHRAFSEDLSVIVCQNPQGIPSWTFCKFLPCDRVCRNRCMQKLRFYSTSKLSTKRSHARNGSQIVQQRQNLQQLLLEMRSGRFLMNLALKLNQKLSIILCFNACGQSFYICWCRLPLQSGKFGNIDGCFTGNSWEAVVQQCLDFHFILFHERNHCFLNIFSNFQDRLLSVDFYRIWSNWPG